jgi:hypothetical protein
MKRAIFVLVVCLSPAVFAGNTYIEFGQFEKVRKVSIAAGALYACSKNEAIAWPKRCAYQFFHFKLDQVVSDYFKLAYRVVAVRDMPVSDRAKIIDEHRKIEQQINPLQEAGYSAIQRGKMKCEDAAAFASEVMKYQK